MCAPLMEQSGLSHMSPRERESASLRICLFLDDKTTSNDGDSYRSLLFFVACDSAANIFLRKVRVAAQKSECDGAVHDLHSAIKRLIGFIGLVLDKCQPYSKLHT